MTKLSLSGYVQNENNNRTMLMPLSDKLMLLILTAAFAFGPFLDGAVLAQVKSPVDPSFPIEAQDPQFASDRVIVKYRAGAGNVVGISPPDGGIGVELIRTLPFVGANLYRVPPGWTVEQTVQWYRGQSGVEYAEPDYMVFPIEAIPYVTTPNDPRFSRSQSRSKPCYPTSAITCRIVNSQIEG